MNAPNIVSNPKTFFQYEVLIYGLHPYVSHSLLLQAHEQNIYVIIFPKYVPKIKSMAVLSNIFLNLVRKD